MRSALSLLALGITLALTGAQTLTLTSIKAVDVTKDNKDQWSVKGYLNDPDGFAVPYMSEEGITAELQNGEEETVNEVSFSANDCRLLNNDKGIICRIRGARITVKKTNRVPKDVMVTAQHKKNKTSSASSYYRVSGIFRRQQFETTLSKPLTGIATIGGDDMWAEENTNYECKEKKGARATKLLCTPGTGPSNA